jgi:uncharacterized protein YndB with AHSA1/START domain
MSCKFEISMQVDASPEEIFDLFCDPERCAKACGARETGAPAKVPLTLGSEWTDRTGPFGLWRVHHLVTAYDRPRYLSWKLTGSFVVMIEDRFEPIEGRTKVTSRFDVERLPSLLSINQYRGVQRYFLIGLKAHFERRNVSSIPRQL